MKAKVLWSCAGLALLGALVAIVSGAASSQPRRSGYAATPGATPAVPAPKPRPDPEPELSGRPLRFEPLPPAQELYRQVTADPYSAGLRRKLATVSGKAGYGAVGEFFWITAEFLDGRPIPPFARPKQSTYKCSELLPLDPEHSPDIKVAQDIARQVDHGEILPAIETARRYLEEDGWSCPVALQWADSLMLLPVMSHEDWMTREMQVRFYITAIEEADARPQLFGLITDAASWERLSWYFERMNDLPSAYVAETLHERSMAEEPTFGEERAPFVSQEIARRLQKLKERMDRR